MTTLKFTLQFHGSVLRASGHAAEGYDASVEPGRPLAPESIKGLMRAAAEHTLRLPGDRVSAAFEPGRDGSRWHWSIDKQSYVDPDSMTGVLHRVQIDAATHTAVPDRLLRARTARLRDCEFSITWLGASDADHLAESVLLLRACAGAIHAVGGQRRRGLGWAGVDVELNDHEIDRLLSWRKA